MKLSFVIPAYNEEAMLGSCLESVMREIQTRADACEVIVVNNASTDRTREVALSFSGVSVVDEPQKGLTCARAAGYAAAHGDLIANIDADTMLPPGWMDTVFHEFGKHERLVALSGPCIFYDLPQITKRAVRAFYYAGYAGYLFNRYVTGVGSLIQGGNFVVRRSAIAAMGGFNQDFTFYGEDADLARRLHRVGEVKFTFALPIYASGRRLAGEGTLKMGLRYSMNYFTTLYLKRPVTRSFIDVRHARTHSD